MTREETYAAIAQALEGANALDALRATLAAAVTLSDAMGLTLEEWAQCCGDTYAEHRRVVEFLANEVLN